MTNNNNFSVSMRRALKSLLLAISAERIGEEGECAAAALAAGRIAARAGVTTEACYQALMSEAGEFMALTWNYMVDGWYEGASPEMVAAPYPTEGWM